jgi:hypothetical protein
MNTLGIAAPSPVLSCYLFILLASFLPPCYLFILLAPFLPDAVSVLLLTELRLCSRQSSTECIRLR